MKRSSLKIMLLIIGITIVINSCEKKSSDQCIKGKYVGTYCGGIVIQILDQSTIGKNWNNQFNDLQYINCVVASVDSVYLKSIIDPGRYFTRDSIFYFKYIDGGYPSQLFIICEPSPFITITSLSLFSYRDIN
jgi:hypothetical protein